MFVSSFQMLMEIIVHFSFWWKQHQKSPAKEHYHLRGKRIIFVWCLGRILNR